jgi:hypothetical protein
MGRQYVRKGSFYLFYPVRKYFDNVEMQIDKWIACTSKDKCLFTPTTTQLYYLPVVCEMTSFLFIHYICVFKGEVRQ